MGAAAEDRGPRRGPPAAHRGLAPGGVTGHGGADSPAAGTAAVHPHVSTGEGGVLDPD